jgi:hypothetical protein
MRGALARISHRLSIDAAQAVATGLNTWAAPLDSVVKEQFTRLKGYVEHGDPAAK